MITLVIGGSDSGKSLLAEKLAVSSGCKNMYYIATMVVMDEDGKARVMRHRAQREGKGFVTLEIPTDIQEAALLMDSPEESTVLLECVTNLAGNLLFDGRDADKTGDIGDMDIAKFSDMVAGRVTDLAGHVSHLIAVSGHYEPADADDEATVLYKTALDAVNERLRKAADKVYDMKDTDNKESGV